MGIRHKKYPIYGVQFHPESILCEEGKLIIKNFLEGKHMIREGIQKLIEGTDLTYEESGAIMTEVMSGKATNAQTAAFLTASTHERRSSRGTHRLCFCYEETLPPNPPKSQRALRGHLWYRRRQSKNFQRQHSSGFCHRRRRRRSRKAWQPIGHKQKR